MYTFLPLRQFFFLIYMFCHYTTIPDNLIEEGEAKYAYAARPLSSPKTINKCYWIISIILNIVLKLFLMAQLLVSSSRHSCFDWAGDEPV